MLPTYLPKQFWGREPVAHPTLGDIRNPALGLQLRRCCAALLLLLLPPPAAKLVGLKYLDAAVCCS